MDDKAQMSKARVFNERRSRPAIGPVIGLALLLALPLAGQAPYQFPPPNNGRVSQRSQGNGGPYGDKDPFSEQKRANLLNVSRQKSIVSDTAKLLKLAQELNKEVEESNSPFLTDAQLRKVAEIGKLAKNVKEKMRYPIGAPSPGLPNTINPEVP